MCYKNAVIRKNNFRLANVAGFAIPLKVLDLSADHCFQVCTALALLALHKTYLRLQWKKTMI